MTHSEGKEMLAIALRKCADALSDARAALADKPLITAAVAAAVSMNHLSSLWDHIEKAAAAARKARDQVL